MKRLPLICLLCLVLLPNAYAQTVAKDAWVRATVAQQESTGAFLELTSPQDARLVEAHSPAAKVVELHEMRMAGNVMQMRPVKGIDLPAGKTVSLSPGGFHIMLIELNGQVKEGDSVPLTLVIEGKDKKRQTVEVKAIARALGAGNASTPMSGEHMH
jgi:copper(I)-binding protein